MVTINVERLDKTTFRKWTDGPKVLIDMYGVSPEVYRTDRENDVTVFAVKDVATARLIMEQNCNSVCTCYFLCTTRNFLELMDVRPDLDVRLLVV